MKNNKLKIILGVSLVGLFGLTACDEVVAKPTQYSETLITTPSTYQEEIYHNIASVVYDAIHDQGIGSDVLDEILYLYAVNAFGPFNASVIVNNTPVPEGTITLEMAAKDETKTEAFVKAHKVYWDASRTDESAALSETEKLRVIAKYNSVMDDIAESMYEKISGGSYSDRHIFSETKFLFSLKNALESVADPSLDTTPVYNDRQILPEVEAKDVFGEKGYLHLENYMSDSNKYVIEEIVPSIYRDLLAEQYLLDETYNSLGRSYARKVNIIKLTDNSNYPNAAYYLAKQLVGEINAVGDDYKITDILARFKQYSNAYIGVVGALSDEAVILNNANLSHLSNSETGDYWLGTDYGDLASKYVKMLNVAQYGINKDYESSFTNNNAYPTYVGLEQQKLALKEKDNTTNGWFIKNGGLTELPDSIRSRLFNIAVANGVKETEADRTAAERKYVDGAWQEAENENAYVCRINGHNYLKTASRVKGDKIDNDILHYDASSKSYYIVEIEEAVSTSKLSKNSTNNYESTRGASVMQEIINEVSAIVGKGESYSTLATKKYLKEMAIEYHDQSVYDYFQNNYPELFD